jgi:hypothetical protein
VSPQDKIDADLVAWGESLDVTPAGRNTTELAAAAMAAIAAVVVCSLLVGCSHKAPREPELPAGSGGICPGPGDAFEVVTVGLILDQDGNTIGTVGKVRP